MSVAYKTHLASTTISHSSPYMTLMCIYLVTTGQYSVLLVSLTFTRPIDFAS